MRLVGGGLRSNRCPRSRVECERLGCGRGPAQGARPVDVAAVEPPQRSEGRWLFRWCVGHLAVAEEDLGVGSPDSIAENVAHVGTIRPALVAQMPQSDTGMDSGPASSLGGA